MDDARTRAAEAVRRLGHAMVGHEVDDELLERVAASARAAAEEVEAGSARTRDVVETKRRMFDLEVADGEEVSHFEECFVSGPHNPLGIGIRVHRERDEAVARVRLGAAFEGAPGRSHGGIVAAIFDDVIGYLLTFLREPGFTGELTVRYLAPTPIHQPLEFRARLLGRDGRKLDTEAEATADGRVVARARATFVVIDQSRFRD